MVNCVSRSYGDQSASKSTWYDEDDDQNTRVETRVERSTDSGIGTLNNSGNKAVKETAGTTDVCANAIVQDQEQKSAARALPNNPIKSVKTEEAAKPKRLKSEDRQNSRKPFDAVSSDCSKSERQKATKASSKSCQSQDRQPSRRELPKIVINGKSHEVEVPENSAKPLNSCKVYSSTDPTIATSIAMVERTAGKNDLSTRNTKSAGGESRPRVQTAKRPLPPITSKRRRAVSESNVTVAQSDTTT